MYAFVPTEVPDKPASVIVLLPGCVQTGDAMANDGDWLQIAAKKNSFLIVAQTNSSNNLNSCFNWFEPVDIRRGNGEAASIAAMVSNLVKEYGQRIDEGRIWVVGFSAGAYMASAMLAAYPDIFSAGAILEGGAYRCATTMLEAFSCMKEGGHASSESWGNLVRNGSGFDSYWQNPKRIPRLMIWQGLADTIVGVGNRESLVKQWTNLHQLDGQSPRVSQLKSQRLEDFGPENNPLIRVVSVIELRHAVAVDPGSEADQGGHVGSNAQDVNLYSSHHIWQFLNREY